MNAVERNILKTVVDYEVRTRLSTHTRSVLAERDNMLDASQYDRILGIPSNNQRTVRVSERGHSGIKGVKGMAASVTMRDAKEMGEHGQHDSLLSQLSTVGVATHPLATGSIYDRAITECRKDWHRSTVRVTTASGSSRIVPVTDYLVLRESKRSTRKGSTSTTRVDTDRKLAASIGTIHEAL